MAGINNKASFLKFLEYLYCDKFVDEITGIYARNVSEIAKVLGLNNISNVIKKKVDFAKMKIH